MTHEKITHIDLFSGIGGFALAADRVFGNVEHIFCDNEPFAQEVLKKHWPTSKIYGDIRTFRNTEVNVVGETIGEVRREQSTNTEDGRGVFILTGGFPCQPFSQAGRRRGEEDDRFLWPEMLRVIREFSPLWVIAENVRGLLTQGGGVVFERVCTDLEAAGYEVQPIIIPAVAVGAPHRRDRVWFVAHRNADSDGRIGWTPQEYTAEARESALNDSQGRHKDGGDAPDTSDTGLERSSRPKTDSRESNEGGEGAPMGIGQLRDISEQREWNQNWLEVATRLCRVDDGLPRRMDRNPRLKALGNAIVPQVAEEVMRAIKYGN
jgi:DNA (cytosine-5)-methyltransferase 1